MKMNLEAITPPDTETCISMAFANIVKWLRRRDTWNEYLAAPRVAGKAISFRDWVANEIEKMSRGERDIPGPNG